MYASYRYNGQSFSTFRDALDAAREKWEGFTPTEREGYLRGAFYSRSSIDELTIDDSGEILDAKSVAMIPRDLIRKARAALDQTVAELHPARVDYHYTNNFRVLCADCYLEDPAVGAVTVCVTIATAKVRTIK